MQPEGCPTSPSPWGRGPPAASSTTLALPQGHLQHGGHLGTGHPEEPHAGPQRPDQGQGPCTPHCPHQGCSWGQAGRPLAAPGAAASAHSTAASHPPPSARRRHPGARGKNNVDTDYELLGVIVAAQSVTGMPRSTAMGHALGRGHMEGIGRACSWWQFGPQLLAAPCTCSGTSMPYRRMKRLSMPFSNRSRSSWFLRDWARACSNRASSCCRLVLSSVSSLLQLTRPTHVCMGAPRQRDPKSVAKAAQVGPHCGVDAACTVAQAWQERHVLHMPCWGRLGLRGTSTARLQVLPSPWCWTGGPHTSLLAPCPCCPRGGFGCSAGTKVGSTLLNTGPGIGGVGS